MLIVISYYDTKRLSSRFYSFVKSLNIVLSNDTKYTLIHDECKEALDQII